MARMERPSPRRSAETLIDRVASATLTPVGSTRGPNNLGGTYVGEQGTAAAGSQAGGNWIYGGPNAEVGMLASGIVKDAGYNLAAGVAAMTIKLKP